MLSQIRLNQKPLKATKSCALVTSRALLSPTEAMWVPLRPWQASECLFPKKSYFCFSVRSGSDILMVQSYACCSINVGAPPGMPCRHYRAQAHSTCSIGPRVLMGVACAPAKLGSGRKVFLGRGTPVEGLFCSGYAESKALALSDFGGQFQGTHRASASLV